VAIAAAGGCNCFGNVANSLSGGAAAGTPKQVDLEDLERRLTILDEMMLAVSHASEELMLKIRREVDSQLGGNRRKMKQHNWPWWKSIFAETSLDDTGCRD